MNEQADRDKQGRFTKGQSGNPKGRPKRAPNKPEIHALVTATLPEVITRLLDLVHSENEIIALQAAIVLRDWYSSPPKFEIAGTNLQDLNNISLTYGDTPPRITLNAI